MRSNGKACLSSRLAWFSSLSVLLLLLTGCKTATPPVEMPKNIEAAPFAMNGRISVSYHGKHDSAGLHWTHRAQSDEVLLLTPLGQTAARIYRDEDGATLDADKQHYEDVDVEALMDQVLGWQLPLEGLHHWVLGMPDPETPAGIERNQSGQIAILRQAGWVVLYLNYEDTLPSRIQLDRGDLKVKLLVDEWDWKP